jgi:hypothetical protein
VVVVLRNFCLNSSNSSLYEELVEELDVLELGVAVLAAMLSLLLIFMSLSTPLVFSVDVDAAVNDDDDEETVLR